MSSFLVTGGAGFIGSHLCDELIKNNHVFVIDNLSAGSLDNLPKGVEFIEGDICDFDLVKKTLEKIDGCFHLAALVSVPLCDEDFSNTQKINVTGTMNIIKNIQDFKKNKSKTIPLVLTSSSAVYGDSTNFPLKESSETKPISLYGFSKLIDEYYGYFANKIDHIPVTALRLFNVYGHRQKLTSSYSGVISRFINAIIHDKPCIIYGDGSQARDFIYVKDVVQFLIKSMETSSNEMRTYNVCTSKVTNVHEVFTILSQLFEKEPKIDWEPVRAGDIYYSQGDMQKAKNELDVQAQIPLEQGLRELVRDVLSENHQP